MQKNANVKSRWFKILWTQEQYKNDRYMVILTLQMTDVILSLFYQPPVPEVYLQDQEKVSQTRAKACKQDLV